MKAFIVAETPEKGFGLVREILSEYTAVASGAHDWDLLNAIQGIAIALEAVQDLETHIEQLREQVEARKSAYEEAAGVLTARITELEGQIKGGRKKAIEQRDEAMARVAELEAQQ